MEFNFCKYFNVSLFKDEKVSSNVTVKRIISDSTIEIYTCIDTSHQNTYLAL
jgi:hypothetical protein